MYFNDPSTDQTFHKQYLMSLLECQHEEKVRSTYVKFSRQTHFFLQPSIQKLVSSVSQDCISHLNEEATQTDAYILPTLRVEQALLDLQGEFSPSFIDEDLLRESVQKSTIRMARREAIYADTVCLDLVT